MEGLKSGVIPFLGVLLTVISIPIAGRPCTEPLHSLPVLADEICVDRPIKSGQRIPNVFDNLDYIFTEQHEDKRSHPRALMVEHRPDGLLT